jgi:hypothetical protein
VIRSAPDAIALDESHPGAIQTLAERLHSPFALVEKMYRNEISQLESHARIRCQCAHEDQQPSKSSRWRRRAH